MARTQNDPPYSLISSTCWSCGHAKKREVLTRAMYEAKPWHCEICQVGWTAKGVPLRG